MVQNDAYGSNIESYFEHVLFDQIGCLYLPLLNSPASIVALKDALMERLCLLFRLFWS
jgi:hypothetical protein